MHHHQLLPELFYGSDGRQQDGVPAVRPNPPSVGGRLSHPSQQSDIFHTATNYNLELRQDFHNIKKVRFITAF